MPTRSRRLSSAAPSSRPVKTPETPLVSVVLAAHDAERFLDAAVRSVLRQTLAELELVVVDDGSEDGTPELLARYEDSRLVVLRNDDRQGLAASLNLGLDHARGRYVARLDADDVAMPDRLERQLARIRAADGVAVLGTGVCELGPEGQLGAVHAMPASSLAVRWHSLFSSPFFHPTVLFDRELLEREGLRYDPSYLESEDYDLWARLPGSAMGRTKQRRSSSTAFMPGRRRSGGEAFSARSSSRSPPRDRCGGSRPCPG